ncbi:conserved exported hypothetical protein [Sphingomonas sp. EC-HK361]|uniref:hypothetical protein n=1 Tax=Sphingomonas sp. EC-HK361 TaxID=2038397 RepID=UPI001255A892|nr:hypothetical protein [Sphingomonas sp. EC-HK361]VVT13397.1 conserved exported hypothetical protein [Sphingomonas sp. EC-HK361]
MRTMIVVTSALALSACATPVTPRYSVGTDNVLALRNLNATGIYVGEFGEPAKDDVKCRGIGRMRLQDDLTHAQFIRKALTDELKVAGSYAPSPARVTITGQLIDIDSSSGLGDGHWSMTLALRSTNGASMTVSNTYKFRAGMAATAACDNVAQAFVPAVQDVIGKAVASPQFAALIR